MCEKKKKKLDCIVGDAGSAKQTVARISSNLYEYFQNYIPVKITFSVSLNREKSKC